MFDICLIDGVRKSEIRKEKMPKETSYYYIQRFAQYIERKHNISLKEYCKAYLGVIWPVCPYKNVETNYKINGMGVVISARSKGTTNQENCPAFKRACEKFKVVRRGSNNPMYGKAAWNKGLDKSNEIVRRVAELRVGTVASEETRAKQRLARALSPKKARHTTKHSPETIEKLRQHTAELWAKGVFNKKTSIETKVELFLSSIGVSFTPQYALGFYSIGIALPNAKLAIECQGTYYHVDPRVYPKNNKPLTSMQKRNLFRDERKKDFLETNGWTLIEIWEIDINDDSFQEELICKLKELKVLES